MRENSNMRSEGASKLHRHVAESAQADYANFFFSANAPVTHGRVRCDSGAEERRRSGEIYIRRKTQNKMFIDDHALRVAAVGHASEVLVRRVERENNVRTKLLEVGFTIWAGAILIDHAAHGDKVARVVLGHCRANFCDTPDYLVTWNNWIIGGHELAPLVTHRMKIGVANAAEENLDLHIALCRLASRDYGGGQRRFLTRSGIGFRLVSSRMHS